jgi:hypothetical protein
MTTRPEIVMTAALKTFHKWIDDYDGKPAGLKTYLFKKVTTYEKKGDDLLAYILVDLLS